MLWCFFSIKHNFTTLTDFKHYKKKYRMLVSQIYKTAASSSQKCYYTKSDQ